MEGKGIEGRTLRVTVVASIPLSDVMTSYVQSISAVGGWTGTTNEHLRMEAEGLIADMQSTRNDPIYTSSWELVP